MYKSSVSLKNVLRRTLLGGVLLCCAMPASGAVPFSQSESLSYKVMYKWGLINKQAGTATLTISRNGDTYKSRLTAASAPWADKFYMVPLSVSRTI